jgi:hypothetical protein
MNTKDKKKKTGCTDFTSACKGFQGMFEKMAKCCPDKGSFTDCSGMMKDMMEMCCGSKTNNDKSDGTM